MAEGTDFKRVGEMDETAENPPEICTSSFPGKEQDVRLLEAPGSVLDVSRINSSPALIEPKPLGQEAQPLGPSTVSFHLQEPSKQPAPKLYSNMVQHHHKLQVSKPSYPHGVFLTGVPRPEQPGDLLNEQLRLSVVGSRIWEGAEGEEGSTGTLVSHHHRSATNIPRKPGQMISPNDQPYSSSILEGNGLVCSEALDLQTTDHRHHVVEGIEPVRENVKVEMGLRQPGLHRLSSSDKRPRKIPERFVKEESNSVLEMAWRDNKGGGEFKDACGVDKEKLSLSQVAVNRSLQPISSLERLGLKPGKRVLIRPKEWAGEVVWAKLARDPWWPAQVLGESDPFIPQDADLPRIGAVPVRFFGTYDFAWIETQRSLSPFQNSFHDRSSAVELREFVIGVNEALELQHTGKLPQGFADAMEDTKPTPPPRGKSKPKLLKQESGGKRQLDPTCAGKTPVQGRKGKMMRFLGLAPPQGSPYATTRAINPNLLLLARNGEPH